MSETASLAPTQRAGGESLIAIAVVGPALLLLATRQPVLALVYPLLLLLVIGLAREPRVGFYAIVALFPFWSMRSVALPPFGELPVHWLLAALLLLVMPLHRTPPARRLFDTSNIWPAYLAFGAIALVGAVLSEFSGAALTNVIRLALGAVFVFLALRLLDGPALRGPLLAVLSWSVGASAALAIVGHELEIAAFASGAGTDAFVRGEGGAGGAINLAFLIVAVIPLVIYRVATARSRAGWLAQLALLTVLLGGLVTTYSRAGLLLLLTGGVAMAIELRARLRGRRLLGLAAGLGLALMLVVPFVPTYWVTRQAELVEGQDRSFLRRLSYLQVGWREFAEAPLLGHGLGTFRELYSRTPEARHFVREGDTLRRFAHNTYLEVLVGTGVVGLAAFLAILWVGFANFTRARRHCLDAGRPDDALLMGAYRASFIVVVVFFALKSAVDNKQFLVLLAASAVAVRSTSPAARR